MRQSRIVIVLTAFLAAIVVARAAESLNVERMATCKDSWLDWKNDPARMNAFAEGFHAAFTQKQGDPFFVPKARTTVAGLPVLQAFPGSIGMALGFSVVVDASFDATRKSLEKTLGKSLAKCDTSDHMRTCELEIGEKKTVLLMSGDDAKSKTSLLGCFYYYEK